MTHNSQQPRNYDAVLGGANPTPTFSAVLGGLEGVKRRLRGANTPGSTPNTEQRIAAIQDAVKYGKPGVAIVIEALQYDSEVVQRVAYTILRDRNEPTVRQALRSFNFYRFFDCISTVKAGGHIAISPDGEAIASLGSNKTVKLTHLQSKELLYTIPKYPKAKEFYVIASDRQTLARSIHTDNNRIEIWYDGQLRHTLYGHEEEITAIAFTPDCKILASGSQDKTIKVWHLSTGKLLFTVNSSLTWGTHKGAITCLAFTPDGKTIVSSSIDQTIKLWHSQTRDKPRTIKVPVSGVQKFALSPNGQLLAGACWDRKIRLWHLLTGEIIRTFAENSDWINCLAFSPDGQTLATGGSYDSSVKLWDVKTGNIINTLTGHEKPIDSLTFSWDGLSLITGSQDKTVKIWGVS